MPARRRSSAAVADEAQAMTVTDVMALVNNKWPGALKTGDDPSFKISRIPCGILSVDILLGGGFARGRHFEIYGPAGVAKTSVVYHLMGNAQRMGLNAAFFDVEGTYDPAFAEHCGVHLSSLALSRQQGEIKKEGQKSEGLTSGEDVVDVVETLLRTRAFDIIGIDSIAALLPQEERDSAINVTSYGTQQAKLMSKALRKLTSANRNTVLVYINQTRESVGGVFAKQSVTSGGRAMGFYAGTRLELIATEKIKESGKIINPSTGDKAAKDKAVGHRVLMRAMKDKTGGPRPGEESSFVFNYKINGPDPIEDLIYLGRRASLVKKNKTHWWLPDYDDEKQNGRKRFAKWLRNNRAIADELRSDIIEYFESTRDDEDEDDAE